MLRSTSRRSHDCGSNAETVKQAERWKCAALAFEWQRVAEAPVSVREFRINQEYFHFYRRFL
jgi:hypothetical protein